VAVEVDQAERAEHVAGAGQRARQLGATAAGEEGLAAGADQLGDARADRRRGRQHVVAGEDPARGVALLAADLHCEVALVAGGERLD
jgi:hypothetical protein